MVRFNLIGPCSRRKSPIASSFFSMIEFRRPAKVALPDGRLLFSAVSQIGNRIILVSTHYFDHPIDFDAITLRLIPSGKTLTNVWRHFRADYEPCVVLSAMVDEAPIALELEYEGHNWTVPLEPQDLPPSSRSLMTLFKEDYRRLPDFVRYYAALGVEQFCLYYNGPLDNVDWSFLETHDATRNASIVIVQWDIEYWWKLSRPTGIRRYDQQGFQHHAQTMAMNHYLHCARRSSTYAFFVDLDEYVFTPASLLEECSSAGASVVFQSWWAAFEDGSAIEPCALFDPKTRLRVHAMGGGKYRTKCFVKLSDVSLMGIHFPHQNASRNVRFLDGFFHTRAFRGTDEYDEFVSQYRPCTVSEFIAERFKFPTSTP